MAVAEWDIRHLVVLLRQIVLVLHRTRIRRQLASQCALLVAIFRKVEWRLECVQRRSFDRQSRQWAALFLV